MISCKFSLKKLKKISSKGGFLKNTEQPTTDQRQPTNQPPTKCIDHRPTEHLPIRNLTTRTSLTSFKWISGKKMLGCVLNAISRMWITTFWLKPDPPAFTCSKLTIQTQEQGKTCSNLTIKKPEPRQIKTPEQHQWHCSGAFIINFEHISHLVLMFLL